MNQCPACSVFDVVLPHAQPIETARDGYAAGLVEGAILAISGTSCLHPTMASFCAKHYDTALMVAEVNATRLGISFEELARAIGLPKWEG